MGCTKSKEKGDKKDAKGTKAGTKADPAPAKTGGDNKKLAEGSKGGSEVPSKTAGGRSWTKSASASNFSIAGPAHVAPSLARPNFNPIYCRD